MISFGELSAGQKFYDPILEMSFIKVCGNAAESIELYSLFTFEDEELMEIE